MFKLSAAAICFISALLCAPAICDTAEHAVSLQPRAGGTLYVDALLNEQVAVTMLVDTGASMLTVNGKTFRQLSQLSAVNYSHDIGFRTASGRIHKVKVYTLAKLLLGDSCELENVDVAVVKNGTNILGMNVLSHFSPIGLTVQPPTLNLSNCARSSGLVAKQ